MSRTFRKCRVMAAGCLVLLGGVRGALGITDDEPESTGSPNPYTVIIDKNVFRLNPPPPPPEAPATTPADLPQYKLTGIVKIGDQTRVLFALAPKDAKELPTYLNLAAGERQGQLELVSIDRDKEEVAVINSGMAMTLSVKSNSYAVSGGSVPAAPGAPPGGRRLPGFPAPPPGIAPPPVAPAAAQAASAASTGGVVIIGGGGNGGSSPNPAVNTDANYAQAGGNYGGGGGYNSYGGGGSGVSVSGNNYGGVGGVGGATIATPNGTVPLNLGATAPPGQTASWPPPEQADPAVQAAALLAASEGLDNNGKPTQGTGGNGNASKGPPMPPIKGLGPPTPQ